MFLRMKVFHTLITDNGVQLVSKEMKEFLVSLAIQLISTPLYCPRASRLVERCNRMIKDALQLALVAQKPIVQSIKDMIWSYHITPNSVTDYSPFLSSKRAQTRIQTYTKLVIRRQLICTG